MDLLKYTLRIADSSIILGQRLSSWCSKGPTLEEDIALSNLSLDLFGQANSLLEYASELDGTKSADDFAFKRNEREFYNLQLTEQLNGHFGDTIVRHFFFSVYSFLFYSKLSNSKDETLAAISTKSLKEIKYHLTHSKSWVIRLGDGTEESNKRIQKSLNDLWQFTGEFFEMDDIDQKMYKEGIGVNNSSLKSEWDKIVNTTLKESNLIRPEDGYMQSGSKNGMHTEHLGHLLSEMQFLPRAYPDAKW
ncbi:MAG: phenylacetate-CoA oxygenase subunit PaaC [Flavobacteriales bacterium]|jgi:ring-1,2-phenylacetyl-CoA epoxidase subunit PaaC|nr:phenylacetate-CoA oxygenase subunit PaaC [Flavobacteriales bacterium]